MFFMLANIIFHYISFPYNRLLGVSVVMRHSDRRVVQVGFSWCISLFCDRNLELHAEIKSPLRPIA